MEGTSDDGAFSGSNSETTPLQPSGSHQPAPAPAPAPVEPQPENPNPNPNNATFPLANINRIMRKVVPVNGKITDEAKEAVRQCVVEYITFVTGEANARCSREHRKILTAEDILWSMHSLGFYDYVGPLTLFLNKYRAAHGGGTRRKVRGVPHAPARRYYLPPPPPAAQATSNAPVFPPRNFQPQAVPVAMPVRGPAAATADGSSGPPQQQIMCGNTIAAGSSSGSGSDQMFWDELAGVDFDDLLGGLDEDWGEEEKGKEKEKGKEAEKGKEKKEAN